VKDQLDDGEHVGRNERQPNREWQVGVTKDAKETNGLAKEKSSEAMCEACFLVSRTGNVSKPIGEEVNELECHDDDGGLEQNGDGFEHDCEELENGEALDPCIPQGKASEYVIEERTYTKGCH
jgi:hypothetical protein